MIVLLGIGFLAGFVTAISPCVLPVLPILLAGGATGRKPLRIVAGLVTSFVVFTLFAIWLLDSLGLPQDLLRWLAIGMLLLLAATLLVPRLALFVERPFAGLTRYRAGGGGFLLGASLGLVFTPCAGPVLGTISTIAAQERFGWRAILLTIAYAVGLGVPMLAIAFGGKAASQRLRSHDSELRYASGILIGLVALGLSFNLDTRFATHVPGYVTSIQNSVEGGSTAQTQLRKITGTKTLVAKRTLAAGLPDYGRAPAFDKTGRWFNTAPLTMKQLRGKVVLVDFWTYSCINCLRTLPHLEAWDKAYRSKGLVIVGVHTPEFAFEHVGSNVEAAVTRLGVKYPVVQDNQYGTWNAYSNQYWPAEYLIDRSGNIRHVNFGEGEYGKTETLIRRLLGTEGARTKALPDTTPTGAMTPESYLGYERLARFDGSGVTHDKMRNYSFPGTLPQDAIAYAGKWRVEAERIVAGPSARLRLHYQGQHVYLVLGGKGRVDVLVDGKQTKTVNVDSQRLYTLRDAFRPENALLELRFTPGVEAYAFTFG